MKRNHKLFTFIVNGEKTEVDSKTSSSLNSAAKKALAQTGNIGRPLEDWNIIINDEMLDGKKNISRHRLTEEDVIWLSLRVAYVQGLPTIEQCMCGSITRIENICDFCKKSGKFATAQA